MIETDLTKNRHEIISDKLEQFLRTQPEGGKLPPIRHLMKEFQISQGTLEKSLRNLEAQGLLARVNGKGYFHSRPQPKQDKNWQVDICFFCVKHAVNNPFYSKVTESFSRTLSDLGCFTNFLIYEDLGNIDEFRNRIIRNAPDVLILQDCQKVSFPYVLQDLGIPTILLHPNMIDENFLSYMIDNVRAIRLAIEHLHELGHQRIAFMHAQGYEGCYMHDQEERIETYYSVMREKALPTHGRLVCFGGFNALQGYEAAMSLLKQPPSLRPTAIIGNDYNSPGIYRAAAECNLKIPQDLSVIGFDKVNFVEYIQPPLTTIDIGWEKTVHNVSKKALELAKGKELTPGQILSEVELSIGGSTGPVPNSEKYQL